MLSGPRLFFRSTAADGVRPASPAPVTGMPRAFAAAMSIAAFRPPVVRRSLRFGREFRRSAGKGVRSRMEEITVNGLRRVMSSCFEDSGVEGLLNAGSVSWKVVISKVGLRDSKCLAAIPW